MTLTPQTDLREFFELRYRPAKLRRASYQVIDPFPRSINWLRRYLGRQPSIGDLTFETISGLQRFMEQRGRGVYSIRKVGRRLGDLARFAARLGIIPICRCVPYVTGQIRQPQLGSIAAVPAGTLEHRYIADVRPRLAAKSIGYVAYTDTVVSRFALFRGFSTPTPTIDDQPIEEFGRWLTATGTKAKTVASYLCALRRVLRMIDRGLCRPTAQDWRKATRRQPPAGSLRDLYESQYKPRRLIDAADKTLGHFETTLAKLNRFAGREVAVDELCDELLAGYMRWLHDAGLAAVTVNQHRGDVCTLWRRFAKRCNLIATLPDVPKLRQHRAEPDAWSIEDLGLIVAACAGQPGMIGEIPAAAYFQTIAYLGYYTALRRGTLLRLPCALIDWRVGVLDVPPQLMKNRRGKKFKLPSDTLGVVRSIWSASRELLLPNPWRDIKPLYRRWDEVLRRAGLSTGRRQKFHKLRRTGATMAAAKGGIQGAMMLLGHSEQYVTERYIDPTKLPGCNVTALLPTIPITTSKKGSRQ